MSLKKNQMLCFWKEVELSARSRSLKLNGHTLSKDDRDRTVHAYVLWALLCKDLLQDARITSDSSLSHWVFSLCDYDVSEVMSVSKQMLACVRNWSPIMGDQGLYSFKHYIRENSITCGNVILMPFWHKIYEFSETYLGFCEINTFLVFISRLTLQDVQWITDEAITKYIAYEEKLHLQSYPPLLIAELRLLAQERFVHFDVSSYPKHGSGATSTTKKGCGIDTKYSAMQMTWGNRQLEKWFDLYHPLIPDGAVSGNNVFTQITFVPKGIDKKRVISAEPPSNMYYQQMLFKSLDNMFQRDDTWHVDLHNQEWNRQLAMQGSTYLDYGTIDLSNASDSVTHSLVSAVMKGLPVYSYWERCRTRVGILPTGDLLHLEKYAPMGSALCFPIECIFFSLIVQLACKHCHVNPYFRVYGDDIVVPTSIFDEVVYLLKELHFDINEEKTFAPGSVFTESCGIECYNGVDVSPCRIPRFYDPLYYTDDNRRTSPGRVMGVITFCNQLFSKGLINLRSYIVHQLLEYFPEVPFTPNGVIGLCSDTSTNFHLKKRWNIHLQRFEYVCIELDTVVSIIDDNRRYQLLLEQYSHSTRSQLFCPEDRIDLMAGDIHIRRVRRMCPLDYYNI